MCYAKLTFFPAAVSQEKLARHANEPTNRPTECVTIAFGLRRHECTPSDVAPDNASGPAQGQQATCCGCPLLHKLRRALHLVRTLDTQRCE